MTRDELYVGIGLTDEMRRAAESVRMEEQEYHTLKRKFIGNPSEFFEEVKQKEHFRQIFLYLYLRFALDAHADYQRLGIGDAVYFDTFGDITIWAGNCIRDYGEAGLNQYNWLSLHVRLELFRLGRLQFQMVRAQEDFKIKDHAVRKGEPYLEMHIPQGEPLRYEACLDSIVRCREFFKGQYKLILCYSWLLSPALKHLLGPEANIIRFQNLFDIYEENPDSRQAEERVFITVKDNPEEYPENTALQRAMKRYLMDGKKVGSAGGILKVE